MSEAWFGLIGVVVGGVISTLWSWLAVVRQELTDAMVAARLVDEELRSASEEAPAAQGTPTVSPDLWDEHRVALAKVLGKPQWDAVAAVYRAGARSQRDHESTVRRLEDARVALAPLVRGKRSVVPQRWRNAFAGRKSR